MNIQHMGFWLVAAHFIADFSLQGDTMAVQKSRHTKNPLAAAVPWYHWLFAHAITHGAAVLLITLSLPLALFETLAHGAIDFAKCEKWFSIGADQGLHLLCKVAYVVLIWKGLAP